jgi:hypothetical protein
MDDQAKLIADLAQRVERLEARQQGKGALRHRAAAAYLDESEHSLRIKRERGDGPKCFRDGFHWKCRIADLDEWLAQQTKPDAKPLPMTPRKPRAATAPVRRRPVASDADHGSGSAAA